MVCNLLELALAYSKAGISVIPILPNNDADGTQNTPFDCSEYLQLRIATPEELRDWFASDRFGLAMVNGSVSGGLECLDLVHADAVRLFRQLVTSQGGSGLLEKLPTAQATVEGGTRLYYRCPNPVPMYRRPLARFELPSQCGVVNLQVLAFLHGKGSWTLLPDSPAAGCVVNQVYKWVGRDLTNVPTVTEDERQLLLESASCLNAWVDPNAILAPSAPDGFDKSVTWERILVPLHWRKIKDFGEVSLWQTPERTKSGYCAVSGIGFNRDLLYMIQTGKAYTKFGALVWFYCGGDVGRARSVRLRSTQPSRWKTPKGRCYLDAVKQAQPLVSCMMPTTGDRRRFLPEAVKCFQRQTYPNLELLIVCDGEDDLGDLIPHDDTRIRYFYLGRDRNTVGAKRNFACERARGNLIAHFDDDDWCHADRLKFQVGALLSEGAEFCGLSLILFYVIASREVWLSRTPALLHPSLWHGLPAGASFLYRRDFWSRSPFQDVQLCDLAFIGAAGRQDHAVMISDYTLYVAMVHHSNTVDYRRDSSYWSPWPGDIREVMGNDLDFYESLRQGRR